MGGRRRNREYPQVAGDITMNTQDTKQLVMQGYQMFQDKDIKGLLTLLADDIEWLGPESESIPFAGEYRGRDQVAQYFGELEQAQDVIQFSPQEFIAEGDKVVVCGTSSWTVKATGQRYDNPWVHIFTIRDGKVARFQQYNDTAAAERAYTALTMATQQAGSQLHH